MYYYSIINKYYVSSKSKLGFLDNKFMTDIKIHIIIIILWRTELAEVYVKSNTLKKVIENTIGTEVLISIDISEKFNPVLNSPEVYADEVIGLLNEIDYMIAAVENTCYWCVLFEFPDQWRLCRLKVPYFKLI